LKLDHIKIKTRSSFWHFWRPSELILTGQHKVRDIINYTIVKIIQTCTSMHK